MPSSGDVPPGEILLPRPVRGGKAESGRLDGREQVGVLRRRGAPHGDGGVDADMLPPRPDDEVLRRPDLGETGPAQTAFPVGWLRERREADTRRAAALPKVADDGIQGRVRVSRCHGVDQSQVEFGGIVPLGRKEDDAGQVSACREVGEVGLVGAGDPRPQRGVEGSLHCRVLPIATATDGRVRPRTRDVRR